MLQIGLPRRVDKLGRIVIPRELRQLFQIEKDAVVEILGTEEGILIRVPHVQVVRKEQ